MTQLFEIVPNFSEGRDPAFLEAAEALVAQAGAHLLDSSRDEAHHRSVLTIAGGGEQVVAAAVALAGLAVERIDLRRHRGLHPRIGALDVLPFVPLSGASLDDAAALAHQAGAAIWKAYRIPSFYYGVAASHERRRDLAAVRRGEFEGLEGRFADPAWAPDAGDIARHESAGAVAIGARGILIAFNVELATGDMAVACGIARAIRERDGGLRTLRALAFPLDDERIQISVNVTDAAATPLYRVFELIALLAAQRGIETVGGELIGCIPRAAVEATAAYSLGVTTL
jgi:glutamate formiminotransferase